MVWVDRECREPSDERFSSNPHICPYSHGFLRWFSRAGFCGKSQEALLLESGIICQKDIQALSTILNTCDTARATFCSKDNADTCFRLLTMNCRFIRRLIGYAPSLRPINDMMIEPTLYCKYLESQETTHISEENQDCPVSNEKQEERVEG